MRQVLILAVFASSFGTLPVVAQELTALPEAIALEDVVAAADLEVAVTELETAHAQNYNALASVLDKVPASVRPTIEQAMENSKKGYQKARENRERVTAMRQAKAQGRQARGKQGQGSAAAGQGRAPGGQTQSGQSPQGSQFGNRPQTSPTQTTGPRTASAPEQSRGTGKAQGKSNR
jgi:hypothetical protein